MIISARIIRSRALDGTKRRRYGYRHSSHVPTPEYTRTSQSRAEIYLTQHCRQIRIFYKLATLDHGRRGREYPHTAHTRWLSCQKYRAWVRHFAQKTVPVNFFEIVAFSVIFGFLFLFDDQPGLDTPADGHREPGQKTEEPVHEEPEHQTHPYRREHYRATTELVQVLIETRGCYCHESSPRSKKFVISSFITPRLCLWFVNSSALSSSRVTTPRMSTSR